MTPDTVSPTPITPTKSESNYMETACATCGQFSCHEYDPATFPVIGCAHQKNHCHGHILSTRNGEESWEEAFIQEFGYLTQKGMPATGSVIQFIRSLAAKERRAGMEKMIMAMEKECEDGNDTARDLFNAARAVLNQEPK